MTSKTVRMGALRVMVAGALLALAQATSASVVQDVYLTTFEGDDTVDILLGRLEFPTASQFSEGFPEPTCTTLGPTPTCLNATFTTSDWSFFDDIGGSGVDLRNTVAANDSGGWFVGGTGSVDFLLQGFAYDLGGVFGPEGDQFRYISIVFDTIDFFESGAGGPGSNGVFDSGNVCLRGSLEPPVGNCFAEDTLIEFAEFRAVSQVPIPAAAWLFGSALLGLGALKRKKA